MVFSHRKRILLNEVDVEMNFMAQTDITIAVLLIVLKVSCETCCEYVTVGPSLL